MVQQLRSLGWIAYDLKRGETWYRVRLTGALLQPPSNLQENGPSDLEVASKPLEVEYARAPHQKRESGRVEPPRLGGSKKLEGTRKSEQQRAGAPAREEPAAAFTEGALQDLLRTLEAAGWRRAQVDAARRSPALAHAWLAHAEQHADSNPGGYAWAGFDSGQPPVGNGSESTKPPLDLVLTTWMRNVGWNYHDWSTCEAEIAEDEKRRDEVLSFEARQALFELWNELHVPFEVES